MVCYLYVVYMQALVSTNLSAPVVRFGGSNGVAESDSLIGFATSGDMMLALTIMTSGHNAWCRHLNGCPDVGKAMMIHVERKEKEEVTQIPFVFNIS